MFTPRVGVIDPTYEEQSKRRATRRFAQRGPCLARPGTRGCDAARTGEVSNCRLAAAHFRGAEPVSSQSCVTAPRRFLEPAARMARRLLTTGMSVNRLTLVPVAVAALPAGGARWSARRRLPRCSRWTPIRAAAERALRARVDARCPACELSAAALDPRLRLPACRARLETHATAPRDTQARALVRVTAPQAAWTLNVPVEIRRELYGIRVAPCRWRAARALRPADVTAAEAGVARTGLALRHAASRIWPAGWPDGPCRKAPR